MLVCDSCGEHNPERSRFCLACGRALADPPAARETRKTVTVLFCDVTGSTALGERLDPESLRAVMNRYFESMRAVLERHGGTVEKFIGDAVMAVFGIPRVHEDDALRAVSAAAAMRERLDALNRELERERGVRIAMRIGVNTGEVVAGDPGGGQKFVTGDPVVVAKRLESAAGPGEVLVGEETARLVRGAARLEPIGPVALKGKAAPVAAWRLLDVDGEAPPPARRHDTPLVGREDELTRLIDVVDAVAVERTCRLVTVVADAGVGKSRLARELAGLLADRATFLTGRCLPYGDGITFWPLRDIVAQSGGLDAAASALGEGDEAVLVVELVRGAIGSGAGDPAGGEETFWAVRKLVEALARDRPLVLCVEDVHWAEPTCLELLEYLAAWIRDAPVLLLCLSRPDLAEEHPSWLGMRADALLPLPPLTESETGELVDVLAREAGLDEPTRARVAGAAEGNPLFVEQLTELLAEEPDALHSLPPTIHALLAARLDRLGREERAVLERAAVMGREFWRRAVVELTPDHERADVGSHLLALVRKNLLQPDAPASRAEDGFRFSHVLVRDAAYAATPKEARADLHERFAGWIEASLTERAELDEILGYHLEQAYRYREQLAPVDARARRLAARAGELLGRAGRRAFERDDLPAAVSLLDRAVALVTEEDPARLELVHEFSRALYSVGEVARAESLLNGLVADAQKAGDRRVEWYATLDLVGRRWQTARMEVTAEELLATAESAVAVFDGLGDDTGLARAWRQIARAHRGTGSYGASAEASERALEHAMRAGHVQAEAARVVDTLCISLVYGPCPVPAAIARCNELLTSVPASLLLEANVVSALAGLEAMRGRFDIAREHVERARSTYDELGLRFSVAGLTQVAGSVELLAGDAEAAERVLREGYEILAPLGAAGFQAALLSEALAARGHLDEARELAEVARRTAGEDLTWQVSWRCAAARVDGAEGVALAREAVAIVAESDILALHGDACATLAEVLAATGAASEAAGARRAALDLYERKGNVAATARVRALTVEAVS